MYLFIKSHIMNKENLFYKHVNEYNYDLKNDDITGALDYEIYEMFDYYLYLLECYRFKLHMCN